MVPPPGIVLVTQIGATLTGTFPAAACFALMAILRLARYNLETEPDNESHVAFSGLPSGLTETDQPLGGVQFLNLSHIAEAYAATVRARAMALT